MHSNIDTAFRHYALLDMYKKDLNSWDAYSSDGSDGTSDVLVFFSGVGTCATFDAKNKIKLILI